ncbi:HAMP domain-containing sensor histidine kinase [Microbacterium sp. APC 3898]|uniref:histidine kinase n=1 Tax=Planococcus notacanthi TaxID=3035188 RepID=A0ABT7ZFP3_9BACL|nr:MULTISPECIES: HAMP domain-containing sensor histidine kinase [Terrabacteria group]MDN3425973.1 HAMP domain-containing sensor histidine kinase [Planococcus sp. APC 4016]MDN3497670.1 HAMP domain-containing sensor histidine kinase [Microbacterium sp. APC 3898]
MKLKNKIHISSTLLMLVILLVLAFVIYFSFSQLTYSSEVNQLQSETNALVAKFNETETSDPSNVLRAYVPVNGLVKVTVPEGKQPSPIQSPTVTVKLPAELEGQSGTVKVDDERFAYVKAPIIWTDGQVAEVTVAQSLRETTNNLNTLRLVLIAGTLLAMIPVVISSVVLGKIVTQPITNLTNTMTRIQRNGQFERLPIEGKSQDELTQMGNTFNEMMSLLEENYSKQEEFVSNASHELKTPLTVIGSYAKLLQRQGMQDEKIAEESVAAIRAETDRMKALIEQLLHIARRSESQVEWTQVDALDLLEQTVTAMNTSYDREFKLITSEQSLPVVTDISKFKQLLYILLDNARKYSSEKVEVVARKNGDTIIQVRDTGIGIPKEAVPYVFERFYRVDKARNRETGGFGLGLSLAKQLADSLKVRIELESIEQLGTTVSIIFSENFNVDEVHSKQEGL